MRHNYLKRLKFTIDASIATLSVCLVASIFEHLDGLLIPLMEEVVPLWKLKASSFKQNRSRIRSGNSESGDAQSNVILPNKSLNSGAPKDGVPIG